MALPRLRRFGGQQQEFQCGLDFHIRNIFRKFWNIFEVPYTSREEWVDTEEIVVDTSTT